jgi:hypothetical protein
MFQNLKVASTVLAVSMAFAGFAFAGPKDKYHGGSVDVREHGYEHGYRDGLHQGASDRDRGHKFKPDIKDADAGYESYMGDKDRYKDGYRSGFSAGYNDGFYNRPARFSEIYGPNDRVRGSADRYDEVYVERRWSVSDVAYDVGYRDGVMAGSDDYSQRRSARPEDQRDFRDADHGYRPSYGDRVIYQRQYRDGFLRGYSDGFRGVR